MTVEQVYFASLTIIIIYSSKQYFLAIYTSTNGRLSVNGNFLSSHMDKILFHMPSPRLATSPADRSATQNGRHLQITGGTTIPRGGTLN